MDTIVELIQAAQSIVLTTHKHCDGDGLGAQLGLYHGLKKLGKKVYVLNVDPTPYKYRFLSPDEHIQYYETNSKIPAQHFDLCLVFDTNDHRLVEPLYSKLAPLCSDVVFIDHHPVLTQGPAPTANSWIDISASSTGEMAFHILKALPISLDVNIARAIYTSIAFDTQLYRFVRNSPTPHLIAAELLQYPIESESIHAYLYSNQTIDKMAFIGKALTRIEYYCSGRLALLKIKQQELEEHKLKSDDSRDVIDMIMNIESLAAAVIIREDAPNEFKISFRSKGSIEVLSIAEKLGGGGHRHASGAYITQPYEQLKQTIVNELAKKLHS